MNFESEIEESMSNQRNLFIYLNVKPAIPQIMHSSANPLISEQVIV